MVEVGQIAVDENGNNLKIVAMYFYGVQYAIDVEQEYEFGPSLTTYIETDFNEKYGNLIWTTP